MSFVTESAFSTDFIIVFSSMPNVELIKTVILLKTAGAKLYEITKTRNKTNKLLIIKLNI